MHGAECVSDMVCDEGHRADPLLMNKTWAERAAGAPAVHLPFARLAKAMEDDW